MKLSKVNVLIENKKKKKKERLPQTLQHDVDNKHRKGVQ